MTKLHIAYGHEYLDWKLGDRHPTNPERALLATAFIEKTLGSKVKIIKPTVLDDDINKLYSIHDAEYVDDVIYRGKSYEWAGEQPQLGKTALSMFAGTARLVEKIVSGETRVGLNPQGAKHHAQYNYSSGFCVFGDMAWAAHEFARQGLKPMYIDWDVHHGDGVENLLLDTPYLTASIHDSTIFPGTGMTHLPEFNAYNYALPTRAGDEEFAEALADISRLADEYKPDVILLAAGADGHETDQLGTLHYTYSGYAHAAKVVADIANKHAQGRVLIGGAGGYQPHTHTPRIWAQVTTDIYNHTKEKK